MTRLGHYRTAAIALQHYRGDSFSDDYERIEDADPAATALPQRNVSGKLAQWAENSSCRSLGSSEVAGKPIAIVERAHAKLPVKCAAKPPFVSKTALHGDLLEA